MAVKHELEEKEAGSSTLKAILQFLVVNTAGASAAQAQARMASSMFVLSNGVVMAGAYQRMSCNGLFVAAEGIYTAPSVITGRRVQRRSSECDHHSHSFLQICLLPSRVRADLFKQGSYRTERVAKASLEESPEEHLVSGSLLYALLLGKRSWFMRAEGQKNNPPLSLLSFCKEALVR